MVGFPEQGFVFWVCMLGLSCGVWAEGYSDSVGFVYLGVWWVQCCFVDTAVDGCSFAFAVGFVDYSFDGVCRGWVVAVFRGPGTRLVYMEMICVDCDVGVC